MYRTEDLSTRKIVELLLPEFLRAGMIARLIQSKIGHEKTALPPQKDGNPFASALTAADILVESHFGMAIAELFPTAAFYGEEHEKDHISPFLPRASDDLFIALDPIDGTRMYADGLPTYSIIMTICRAGKIAAAIDYRPARGEFFIGIAGEGMFTTCDEQLREKRRWHRMGMRENPPRSVLTYYNDEAVNIKMERAGLQVIRVDQDYRIGMKRWDYPAYGIVTGEIGAIYRTGAQLIDWVALAFIARMGGGAWNNPPIVGDDHRAPLLIAAASRELYDTIQRATAV